MDSVGSLLPKVLAKRGIKHEVDASLVVYTATTWLSEKFPEAEQTITVQKLERETLLIACSNPILQQECFAQTEELLTHLQEKFGEKQVKNIRIVRV